MTKVLVTGANGFIGRPLLTLLKKQGFDACAGVRIYSRTLFSNKFPDIDIINFDLDDLNNNDPELLQGFDVVVHLAAAVHRDNGDINYYRKINVEGTKWLAKQSVSNNVKRFVYISSIKVHGEYTRTNKYNINQKLKETDSLLPQDPYALSKYEAELAIYNVCQQSKMDYVILRPPLIYGPGVKANFLRLLQVVMKAYPLPLASVNNQRSLIYVGNLCHSVLTCLEHPKAANQIFLVSDYDCSVPELISKIAQSMGSSVYIFPFPVVLLKMLGAITGKKMMIDRLTESLLIDSSKIKQLLNWIPPYTPDEGIAETTSWFLTQH